MFSFFNLFSIVFAFNFFQFFGDQIPPAEKAEHLVQEKTIKKLNAKYGMTCCGTGGAWDHDKKKIKKTMISFYLLRSLSMNECRKMILDCAQIFLSDVQSDNNLQQYINQPFTYENIEVTVYIRNSNGYDTYDPEIGIVSFEKPGIKYFTRDRNDIYKLNVKVVETYEEALQKLEDL